MIQILAKEDLGNLQIAGDGGRKCAALLARIINDLRILLPRFTIEEGPRSESASTRRWVEKLRLAVELKIRRFQSQGLTTVQPCPEGESFAGLKTPAQVFPAQQYSRAGSAQDAGL